ncbi:MAG: CoA pyrophosphatase [Magnetococcales bacterium]|nr:CoA pyrophosphatase [Magnetococcales bacterium]
MLTPDSVQQCLPALTELDRIGQGPGGLLSGGGCVVAAVLVPLIFGPPVEPEGSGQVLLIRRSQEVRHHKGQIAFPGGRWDRSDATVLETALRETVEELGPDARPVRLLGRLTPVQTIVTGFIIHPFVALMPEAMELRPEPREVAGVMTVPLHFFLKTEDLAPESYHYGPHVIWGATARILNQLVTCMRGIDVS